MDNVLVSVVVPIYNAERYLKKCLDSVLSQTMADLELICVDDGSTDESKKILDQYSRTDSRVRVISQKNQYAGMARNAGMKLAKGKYLFFLDADDFICIDHLEKLTQKAIDNNVDIVLYDAYVYNNLTGDIEECSWTASKLQQWGDNVITPDDVSECIFDFTRTCVWNKLYRAQFIYDNQLFFQNTKRANDLFFSFLSLILAKRIYICSEKLIYYRINNSESLQGTNSKFSLDFFDAFTYLKKQLDYMNVYEKYRNSFLNAFIDNCQYNFNCQKEEMQISQFYSELRSKMIGEFDISTFTPNKYTDLNKYYEVIKLVNCSCEQYKKYQLEEKKWQGEFFLFPFWKMKKNSRVVLYGAGNVGKAYFFQLKYMHYCKDLFWVDQNYKQMQNSKVGNPSEILENVHSEYVVIALADESLALQVAQSLKDKYNITAEMICIEAIRNVR